MFGNHFAEHKRIGFHRNLPISPIPSNACVRVGCSVRCCSPSLALRGTYRRRSRGTSRRYSVSQMDNLDSRRNRVGSTIAKIAYSMKCEVSAACLFEWRKHRQRTQPHTPFVCCGQWRNWFRATAFSGETRDTSVATA